MKAALQQKTETRTITAAEFKAKCLQLMDEVNEKHLTLIVTKRGKPVAQLSGPPTAETKPFRSIFGRTPGGRMPSEAEWRKMKDQFADEWDESTKKLARHLNGDSKEPQKSREKR